MLRSFSGSLIARGALALLVGAVALAWPGVTVLALVVLFAVSAFSAAATHLSAAFAGREAKPVALHLLIAGVDTAAGVTALVWPGVTALALVVLVASWALVTGWLEVFAAFRTGEAAGTRALLVLTGLVSVGFGTVLLAHPAMGAFSLALVFGLFNLVSGTTMVVRGLELRSVDRSLRSLIEPRVGRPAHV